MAPALLLAGCVSIEPDTDAESREKEMEEYAESFGLDVDVEVWADGEVASVAVDNLGGFGGRVGNDLDLPDDFPPDVPIHPDLAIMSATPVPGGYSVMGQVASDAEEVERFFGSELEARGWVRRESEGSSPVTPSMRTLGFEKDGRVTTVMLILTGEDATTVQLCTAVLP
jgi:hypothetical protein